MNLKPIGDRLVLKKSSQDKEQTTSSGIVLPSSAKEEPVYAEVIAIGAEITNNDEIKDTISNGDKVIYSKYAGTEVSLDDEDYILVKYEDILAVVE